MRVRPLNVIAAGIVAVAIDFRVVHVDVLPDVLGWGLVAIGTWRIGPRSATVLAGVAAAASLARFALPYRMEALDPLTGEVVPQARVEPGTSFDERLVFEPLDDVRLTLALIAVVVGAGALFAVLRVLERRARALGDVQAGRVLRLAGWAIIALWAVPQVGVAVVQLARDGSVDAMWNGNHELLALAGLIALLGAAIFLAEHSNRGWTATDDERLTPWSSLMTSDGRTGAPGY